LFFPFLLNVSLLVSRGGGGGVRKNDGHSRNILAITMPPQLFNPTYVPDSVVFLAT